MDIYPEQEVPQRSSATEFTRQQGMTGGVESSGSAQNMDKTAPSVVVMIPATASVKQKVPYKKRFPEKLMFYLSSIQVLMSLLAILTQAVGLSLYNYEAFIPGTGIWCGLVFGISGVLGIRASRNPSSSTIVAFMVVTIISATFCLPLFVYAHAGILKVFSPYYYHPNQNQKDDRRKAALMLLLQIVISVIQAITAIVSSAFACKANHSCCACCRPTEERTVLYHAQQETGSKYQHFQKID